MITKADLARRQDTVEERLAWLDQHGTRGVEVVRVQILEQAKDIGAIESKVSIISDKLDIVAGSRAQRFAAYALAILPLYVLLFLAVFGHRGGM